MTDGHQPTPLRTGQMGLVRTPGASAEAIKKIVEEARAWGLLGFDLEWVTLEDGTRVITWCGIGHAGRAVSLWWPTLPEASQQAVKDAIKDATLPKIAHNIQADIKTWEMNFGDGAVGGLWEDTMLMHHASSPGIAHDLQAVTSQYLVVPPWKTWHRDAEKAKKEADKAAVAAQKQADKDHVKAARANAQIETKMEKVLGQARTQIARFKETYSEGGDFADAVATIAAADTVAEAQALLDTLKGTIATERERLKGARAAAKQAAHEAKNAAAAATKAAKKARAQVDHEAHNVAAAAEAAARKEATKKLFQSPRVATANPPQHKGST